MDMEDFKQVLNSCLFVVFDFLQPVRKYSGDTHIKLMIPEIRQAICDELSIEKSHSKCIIRLYACIWPGTRAIEYEYLHAAYPKLLIFWPVSYFRS